MKKIIGSIFSDKYVILRVNFIQRLMYRLAYPLAVLLNKLHQSPNQITTQSLVFSVFAFVALVYDKGWFWFSIFWGVSVLLDFCDGTVARMTKRISKPAFRYDHMSDLFKIFLLFMGAGIRYDNKLVWVITLSATFLYMYYTVLNHDLNCARRQAEKDKELSKQNEETILHDVSVAVASKRIRERYRVVAWIVKYDLLYKMGFYLWAPLVTIDGHTLLLFFLLPFGSKVTFWALSYFGIVTFVGIVARITGLLKIPKP